MSTASWIRSFLTHTFNVVQPIGTRFGVQWQTGTRNSTTGAKIGIPRILGTYRVSERPEMPLQRLRTRFSAPQVVKFCAVWAVFWLCFALFDLVAWCWCCLISGEKCVMILNLRQIILSYLHPFSILHAFWAHFVAHLFG